MQTRIQRLWVLTLACICLVAGCGGSGAGSTYPVVLFTDIHFNPFYDQTLFSQLNRSDASAWAQIFESSTATTPSTWGQDTNYPLLVTTLQSIQQHLGTSPVVVFTGDILGHNLAQTYFTLSGSEDVAALEQFLDKTVELFQDLSGRMSAMSRSSLSSAMPIPTQGSDPIARFSPILQTSSIRTGSAGLSIARHF